MLEPLALRDYEFMIPEVLTDIDWTTLNIEGELRYISKRPSHNTRLFSPCTRSKDFSPYCKQLLEIFGPNLNKPSGKNKNVFTLR